MAHANANVDANKALDQIAQAWPEFKKTLGIGEAAIWNLSGKTVEVRVYNYIDVVYWIPAMKTLVAEGKVGKVAASGSRFKVHIHDEEYLVQPGRAYVYQGPGSFEEKGA